MDTNKIIHLAADAGRIILESGGETYRVEETILRICGSFHIKNADSFVTPTGIIISIVNEKDETISLVKRIHKRTVNLEKVSMVNDLSRKITRKALSIEDIEKELLLIDSLPVYKKSTLIISAAIASGFFTLLFGGNYKDFIVAFFIGIIIKWISLKLSAINVNDFFVNILGGAIAALISLTSVYIKFGSSIDKIIIGSIMLLVPGLAITNAIRDTIAGDLVSGISRAVEAFLTAIAIAVGTGIVFNLWILLFGGINI